MYAVTSGVVSAVAGVNIGFNSENTGPDVAG